jgi:hypothetical protein
MRLSGPAGGRNRLVFTRSTSALNIVGTTGSRSVSRRKVSSSTARHTNRPAPMTTFDAIDAALAARGWSYDVEIEFFTDGSRRIDYQWVQNLVPDLTDEQLASYQDQKYDEYRRSSAVKA